MASLPASLARLGKFIPLIWVGATDFRPGNQTIGQAIGSRRPVAVANKDFALAVVPELVQELKAPHRAKAAVAQHVIEPA